MFFLLLSIAIPFYLGYLLVWRLWPARPAPAYLIAILALPAGWSLTSVLYFFWLILSGGRSSWYPAMEILLLVTALACVIYQRKRDKLNLPALTWRLRMNRSTAILLLALLAAASLSFVISFKLTSINPWAYWDAWARINVKARFLFAGGEHWPWIFESIRIAHHDYPLLLPCTVARTWAWMGGISLLGPQVLSIVWGVWSLVSLFSVVAWLRGPVTAVIVSLASLTFTPFLLWSAGQYADIPLACYMVLGCAMMVGAEKFSDGAKEFGFLAGFFAGSAAWCKNEGLVFLFLIILWWIVLWARRRAFNRAEITRYFLAGLSLIGSAVLTLKIAYAGKPNVLADHSSSSHSIYALLVDGERHGIILDFLRQSPGRFWNGWPLLLLAIAFFLQLLWRRQRVAHVGPFACAVVLAAIYYLIIVTTPYDLLWHLNTAMDRLILQVWPLFLFGFALLFEEVRKEA